MKLASRNQLIGGLTLLALASFFLARCYVKRLGTPCMAPTQCNSGMCLSEPAGDSYCSDECTKAEDCGAGWTCEPLERESERSLVRPKNEIEAQKEPQKPVNYCIRPPAAK